MIQAMGMIPFCLSKFDTGEGEPRQRIEKSNIPLPVPQRMALRMYDRTLMLHHHYSPTEKNAAKAFLSGMIVDSDEDMDGKRLFKKIITTTNRDRLLRGEPICDDSDDDIEMEESDSSSDDDSELVYDCSLTYQ